MGDSGSIVRAICILAYDICGRIHCKLDRLNWNFNLCFTAYKIF